MSIPHHIHQKQIEKQGMGGSRVWNNQQVEWGGNNVSRCDETDDVNNFVNKYEVIGEKSGKG